MRYKAFIAGLALAVASAASVSAQAGDQAFVTKLAGVAMAEVELGKLAKEKASSREVRAFGQRMIDDHTKAGDELKGIAQRKNLAWPAALPPDAIALKDKLSKLNGAAFDRAYIDEMVKGHTEVLGEVKKGAQSASDPDVKAWATKATSSVQAHLTHAQDQQKELGKAATH
jgi:putative membrane protein